MIQRATKADIEAILEARRQATIQQVTQVAVPALPPKKKPDPVVTAQNITQPAAVPSVQVAPPTVVSDKDVERFLEDHLPMLIKAAQDLVTPPFNLMEVVQLGTAFRQAVAARLPQVKGAEARALVVVIVRYLWRKYAPAPHGPTLRRHPRNPDHHRHRSRVPAGRETQNPELN